ncbi:hypothetical protein [Romboutsia sp.]|uniref:hypothetical protein n=1 Tax=Romboutsia sp. TaxID=1965302 RepID=UPI002BEDBC23|nr:hypothetical protein [Romboutsia sp.]HSQ88004.1 hypothetical protein [Romboutsia sp.]
MKCNGNGCKKDLDASKMSFAKNLDGEYPKSGLLYCPQCAEEEYQRKLLVDYLHNGFIYKGYYKGDNSRNDKREVKRLMGLINTQISNLRKDAYTCEQIRLILEYMLTKENVEFGESILGLVPYYYVKTSKYHRQLFKIGNSKTYGYIEPTKVDMSNKPAHKPNKSALRLTNMESV